MAWGVTGDIFYFRERFYDNGELSSHLSSDTWHKVSVPGIFQYFLRTPPLTLSLHLLLYGRRDVPPLCRSQGEKGRQGKDGNHPDVSTLFLSSWWRATVVTDTECWKLSIWSILVFSDWEVHLSEDKTDNVAKYHFVPNSPQKKLKLSDGWWGCKDPGRGTHSTLSSKWPRKGRDYQKIKDKDRFQPEGGLRVCRKDGWTRKEVFLPFTHWIDQKVWVF